MSMIELMCGPENASVMPYNRSLWEIEVNFDLCQYYTWHTANWSLCFPFIAVYLLGIVAGRKYMESRSPFQLRGALLCWNVALAAFSMVCSWRLVTALIYANQIYGFTATVCRMDQLEQRQAIGIWVFLYVLSKVVEFGDTVFIVLRKSPLIFLHWYHHVTVAFSVWSTGVYASPMQNYYCTINMTVHSFMYTYFALKVARVHVPKAVSMAITSLQILQFVAAIFITGYTYSAKSADPTCFVSGEALVLAGSIGTSYLLLFSHFFIKSYTGRSKTPRTIQNGQFKKLE